MAFTTWVTPISSSFCLEEQQSGLATLCDRQACQNLYLHLFSKKVRQRGINEVHE